MNEFENVPEAEVEALKKLIAHGEYDLEEETEDGFTFKHVASRERDARRWFRRTDEFFYCVSTGRYWMKSWDQGLTENQEHEHDTYGDPVEVERHEEQVTKTVVTWTKKRASSEKPDV